jgi:hypothetical protein
MVVFSTLAFCNVDWPYYPQFSHGDTGMVVLDGWASAPGFLVRDTNMVVAFDPCTLYVDAGGLPAKDTVIEYLVRIAAGQYAVECVSCAIFPDSLCALSKFLFGTSNDTAFVRLGFTYGLSGVYFQFVEVNGQLALVRSFVLAA